MSDCPGDQPAPIDALDSKLRELVTPKDMATYVAIAMQGLADVNAHRGPDLRYEVLDRTVSQGIGLHGVEFLRELVAHVETFDPSQLGFADAVKPDGRLWDHRQAFAALDDKQMDLLGVDAVTISWHKSRKTALRGIESYAAEDAVIRLISKVVLSRGVPEWAFTPEADEADRVLLTEVLDAVVHRYRSRGEVAPLANVYGVGQILQADADAILADHDMSDLKREVSVARWRNVAKAYGESIGRQSMISAATAKQWVRIVERGAALNFDAPGSRRLRTMVADVETETGLRLWQALDAAVLTGSAPRGMTLDWFEFLGEMRTVKGRPELTARDLGVLANSTFGIGGAVGLVEPQFVTEGRTTRDHYGYLRRMISNVADAVTTLPHGTLSESDLRSTASLCQTFLRVHPPLLPRGLAREGLLQAGRLAAALTLHRGQFSSTDLPRGNATHD